MIGTPSFESPLTYIGVLLVTIGVYLTLSGFGILKIEKYSSPEGVKSWGSGLLLILMGFAAIFILPAYVETSAASKEQEVSILGCQNNPNSGIVKSGTSIILVWGWSTDDEVKRDEIISISSFVLELDGQAKDVGKAQQILKSTNSVFWRLSIGDLPPGIHEVRLTRIFAREFSDSDGTFPAGRQETEICELTIQ